MRTVLLLGTLATAPLFSQTSPDPAIRDGKVAWFQLTETRDEVLKRLGPPATVADFGRDFQSWQYQIGHVDRHEHTHVLVFRRSTDRLISVSRNYEPEQPVDELLEGAMTVRSDGDSYPARVRRLDGGRALIGMGVFRPGQSTGQLMLIAEAELRYFYSWIANKLNAGPHLKR